MRSLKSKVDTAVLEDGLSRTRTPLLESLLSSVCTRNACQQTATSGVRNAHTMVASSTVVSSSAQLTSSADASSPMATFLQSLPAKRGLACVFVGGWFTRSWIACWVKDGCLCERGEGGGGCLWFSTKLCRWAAICPALWLLDCELDLSRRAGGVVPAGGPEAPPWEVPLTAGSGPSMKGNLLDSIGQLQAVGLW